MSSIDILHLDLVVLAIGILGLHHPLDLITEFPHLNLSILRGLLLLRQLFLQPLLSPLQLAICFSHYLLVLEQLFKLTLYREDLLLQKLDFVLSRLDLLPHLPSAIT